MKSNNTHSNLLSHGAVVAGILLIGATVAKAQAPVPEAKKGWETTPAAGLTLTRGTRDTLLVTAVNLIATRAGGDAGRVGFLDARNFKPGSGRQRPFPGFVFTNSFRPTGWAGALQP